LGISSFDYLLPANALEIDEVCALFVGGALNPTSVMELCVGLHSTSVRKVPLRSITLLGFNAPTVNVRGAGSAHFMANSLHP